MAKADEIKRVGGTSGTTTVPTMANDGRLTQADANAIKTQGEADLNESNSMYDGMIATNETLKNETLDMVAQNEAAQKDIANQNTDFIIDKVEQQKDQTYKDYTKEQSGAYVDYQKASNPYGANAEAMASNGLTNTGYSESSQVAMYVAYQNRIAVARDSYQRAMVDYDNQMTEAKLQNNSLLAEIAAQALEKRMEAIITFTQQGNALLTQKADAAYKIKQTAHSNWMDVLKEIEQQRQYDTTLAEQQRQHNEEMSYKNASLAEQQRQYDAELAYKNASLAEQQRQHDEEMAYKNSVFSWEQEQAKNKTSTGGSYTSNKGGTGDTGNDDTEKTTITYNEAIDYLKNNGVSGDIKASLWTSGEWTRRKNAGNEVAKSYKTYEDYLKDYISFATGK